MAKFYGDSCRAVIFYNPIGGPGLVLATMSTAVVVTYTSEGFVIGADRRQRDDDGTVVTESAQRVFPIESRNGASLAYTLIGTVRLGDVFSFEDEMPKAVAALAQRNPAGLSRYAELIARQLKRSLVQAFEDRKGQGNEPFYPTDDPGGGAGVPGYTIARVVFAGFYDGYPSWAAIRFFHDRQRLASPAVNAPFVTVTEMVFGSKVVGNLLYSTNDPRFSKWRMPECQRPEGPTLAETIKRTQNYILACSSPEGRAVDPEVCNGIGDKMTIGTVRRSEGFKWVEGFEP